MGKQITLNGFPSLATVAVMVILFFWFLLSPVQSLYVHIRASDPKCYIEEIPDDTTVVGKYKLERESYHGHATGMGTTPMPIRQESTLHGLHIEVTDPNGATVLSKVFNSGDGRFSFVSTMSGEHKICYTMKWNRLIGAVAKYRLHLSIQIGGHAVDYEMVSKKEKLTSIQLRIRRMLDHTDQISKDLSYQRTREERFRRTSESTNSRVLYAAVLQTIMLLTIGYIQVLHLKEFFISKKLV